MLGVLDGKGEAQDPDPVNRVSARVQCVVAAATPTDLEHFDAGAGVPNVASFMGQVRPGTGPELDPVALSAYREASPIVHVSASAAALLLLHGDADQTVPFHQAERMLELHHLEALHKKRARATCIEAIGLTAETALQGPERSVASSSLLCSWAGLCPGTAPFVFRRFAAGVSCYGLNEK
jgi:hypothetical protein